MSIKSMALLRCLALPCGRCWDAAARLGVARAPPGRDAIDWPLRCGSRSCFAAGLFFLWAFGTLSDGIEVTCHEHRPHQGHHTKSGT